MESNLGSVVRYIGIDAHKQYVMVGGVNAQQQVVLKPQKILMSGLTSWVAKHLRPTDAVVLEAAINTWTLYDQLQGQVARVVVAHAEQVKLIASAQVKTDKRDALTLARLLAAQLIPEVWVPPHYVRELRELVAYRQLMVTQRTKVKNHLHSMLHRHNLTPPSSKPFALDQRVWWQSLALRPGEQWQVQHDLALLDDLSATIDHLESELAQCSVQAEWIHHVPFLVQLPGISLVSAMTILSAVGDIARFPSAKHLVGYAGLGTRVHASGQTYRTGGITKHGRRELRTILVECAWVAVRSARPWRERFEQLTARLGKKRAIVAIARKLLVVVWHVLSQHRADREADPVFIAQRLMTWSSSHRLAATLGVKTTVLVRYALDLMGIAQDLTRLDYYGKIFNLPAPGTSLPVPGRTNA